RPSGEATSSRAGRMAGAMTIDPGWWLLRQGPDVDREFSLIPKRMLPRLVDNPLAPSIQIRNHAFAIPPRARARRFQREPGVREQMFESRLGRSRAMVWLLVDAHEKGGGEQEMPAGLQHCRHVHEGPVGPQNVLQDLLGDDEVERSRQCPGGYVVCGIGHA